MKSDEDKDIYDIYIYVKSERCWDIWYHALDKLFS